VFFFLWRGPRIGEGAVVGARAMVNGPLPPYSLSAGTPARVLRENIRWEE
jgi:acetyltransferase-like isoleucine patch superfamily enzyme